VLYFTQVMAVALGLDQDVWGMDKHYVDPLFLFSDLR
jgi:heterodisulfide reductase subunit B